MYGLPTDNVNLVATAMEELTSRSLSNDVADSLGLRLQRRRADAHAAQRGARLGARGFRARRCAATGSRRSANKQVTVQELGGTPVGKFPLAGTIAVPGASFRLARLGARQRRGGACR